MPSYPSPHRPSMRSSIDGPPELLQCVPYLLGFRPEHSLVLLGLRSRRLVVTARLDLDGAEESGALPDTIAAMANAGSQSVIAAVHDDGAPLHDADLRWRPVLDALTEATDRHEVRLSYTVITADGRWRHDSCPGPDCCPPGGHELPGTTPPFVAQATLSGRAPLPDRESVSALLDPVAGIDRKVLQAGIADAEKTAVEAVLAGAAGRHRRAAVRALFTAARASEALGWDGVSTDEAARFAVALSGIDARDAVWMGIDDGRIDGRPLWRHLGCRLPAPYSAAPLFLFGWASWRAGDGALAGVAAVRAIGSDPGYTAADLLAAALTQGVDPRRFPRLRRPA